MSIVAGIISFVIHPMYCSLQSLLPPLLPQYVCVCISQVAPAP